jgi:hypothetical protein
MANMQQAPQ